ncbi:MAG: molybdenum cofactor biosynthesis protein B [Porticoccus sp.]|nr:molybdenum cofactor biosynthesis protein B [Porticoccus sp.]
MSQHSKSHATKEFLSLGIAVLTVSDTRTLEEDTSGQLLVDRLTESGHNLADRALIPDDVYQLRAEVSRWIADPKVQVILTTGGTGFTDRDSTPEALAPLFDKHVEGFGELFRHISYQEIGTSTLQSRAVAGLSNRTLIFCMPGSTNACRTAWDNILGEQLDARTKPCNFIPHVKLTAVCESRG